MQRFLPHLGLLLAIAAATPALAHRFALPPTGSQIVGALTRVRASGNETLLDIARRYRVGQDEIVMANPSVDRWLPADGAIVTLPTAYILPRAERRGVVLNVPEMRLYYYEPHVPGLADVLHTFPVSIGRMDWATPLGETRIVAKTENPSWRPPKSVIAELASKGETLPEVVPPGPDNPLGRFALRLALPGYLIHGTNKPFGVGMRVTRGCVRMYPDDIASLYRLVRVGTPVTIVDQPVKLGWLDDRLYIESSHPVTGLSLRSGSRDSPSGLQEGARSRGAVPCRRIGRRCGCARVRRRAATQISLRPRIRKPPAGDAPCPAHRRQPGAPAGTCGGPGQGDDPAAEGGSVR